MLVFDASGMIMNDETMLLFFVRQEFPKFLWIRRCERVVDFLINTFQIHLASLQKP